MVQGSSLTQDQIENMSDQELAVWYNDHVIYPDKVRLNRNPPYERKVV